MKKLLFFTSLLILGQPLLFAQSLSNYQYINVPNTFSFQKTPHQYNLNKHTQFLLNKYNFKAYIEGEEYDKLADINACEILRLKATSKGFTTTKMNLFFIDCKGKTIYTSTVGTSRLKDFDKAYTEALRNIFKDPTIRMHKYVKPLPKKKKLATVVKPKPIIVTPPTPKSIASTTNTPSYGKTVESFQLNFELRGKHYHFVPASKTTYSIIHNSKTIGLATQLKNDNHYKIEAGSLTGSGYFDDYGNFILKRINPANKKEIIDTMARTK